MPRRKMLTDRQREALLDLPTEETAMLRHYTLADDDLEIIRARRRPHNRFGFALQLCALRYPGRLLAPGEVISAALSRFLAAQLGLKPDDLVEYATREETRREHLATLREFYGYKMFTGRGSRDLKAWLERTAETARSNEDLARRFVEQCRATQTILPGITVIERLCADALVAAERRIDTRIADQLDDEMRSRLDALLTETADGSVTRFVWLRQFEVGQNSADMNRLLDRLELLQATHWAFGQLASIVGAPASYLRQLPAPLAGINLQYGLTNHRAEQVKTFETEDGRTELRAVTGPDYGRIHDHELVEAVQRIAGNGTGDTRWKVPGVLDWSTGVYNPDVEISRDTTTLYASDRDVFLFLVDDRNPIEAGKLPDGSPDLYFRGFYCWNSEVGAKTLGMASFYLRAVCQNRNLWGVEDFQEIKIRHSKYAASRFAHEAEPALTRFANSSPQGFVNGIKAARQQVVARSDEDRADFLRKRGFSKAESGKIIEKVLMEEGRPPESIFDFVQGITRLARDKTQQDARLDMEGRAKKLLDRVS